MTTARLRSVAVRCSCGSRTTVEYEPGAQGAAKCQLEIAIERHRQTCAGEIDRSFIEVKA